MKNFDFDSYRKWFNHNFSLSFNGKFKGLRVLGDKLALFVHKLNKLLNHRSRHQCPLGDIIVMHISGQTIKLYFR